MLGHLAGNVAHRLESRQGAVAFVEKPYRLRNLIELVTPSWTDVAPPRSSIVDHHGFGIGWPFTGIRPALSVTLSRMQARLAVIALSCALVACGDGRPPAVEVSAGRLTARIAPDPAQITLLVDGSTVWSTRAGAGRDGDGPPHGFAATGSRAVMIEEHFGSYKFAEDPKAEKWRAIDRLDDVLPTDTGATFTLRAGDVMAGSGELTFVAATRSGPDPDAAGFPRHVRIELTATTGERISLASTTDPSEHLVGLGGQSFDIDHQGETVPLWVQEDGIGKEDISDAEYAGVWFLSGRKHSTHTPMPMMLSSKGYAVALDTDARAVFALGSERPDAARFEAWSSHLDLQVFIGDDHSPADALGHMVAWVGKPDRPPLTIFAPWVDALFGSTNVRRVAKALRDNGISSSVIWTEDWRGGADTALGYTLEEDWRVDRTLYPDFEQLGTDLRASGFAFLTYHNTFIDSTADISAEAAAGGYTLKDATGAGYVFTGVKFNPSTLLDLTNPAAVTWAKGVMTEALALGSDGWMADFGEWLPTDAVLASGEDPLAVHNRYPVDWARMNHEMFATSPAGRPRGIYFMRSAWLHSQPLSSVVWAGDQQTDFSDGDGMPSVIPIGVNLGLAGFPYFGSDIAGYMSQGTMPTTNELFYRWTSFGALTPVMRTHHGKSARQNVQWEHDAGTIAQFRRWSRFHMQLAAYLSGSIASFERDGLPLMRLVALAYPSADWAWTATDEYLLGDRILVAPIVVAGASSRTVQLPGGAPWFPLFGGPPADGPSITATAGLTEIPAFVPAATVLVLYPDGVDTVLPAPATSSAVTVDSIGFDREVWLYPGAQTGPQSRWHDDNGVTGSPQYTWSGRTTGGPPATATFNGSAVTVTTTTGVTTVTVVGDGELSFAGGGTLTIARGHATSTVTVRLH